jgi:hypothetical protein
MAGLSCELSRRRIWIDWTQIWWFFDRVFLETQFDLGNFTLSLIDYSFII